MISSFVTFSSRNRIRDDPFTNRLPLFSLLRNDKRIASERTGNSVQNTLKKNGVMLTRSFDEK